MVSIFTVGDEVESKTLGLFFLPAGVFWDMEVSKEVTLCMYNYDCTAMHV